MNSERVSGISHKISGENLPTVSDSITKLSHFPLFTSSHPLTRKGNQLNDGKSHRRLLYGGRDVSMIVSIEQMSEL
jgi:hypothetical protein